MRIGVNTRLLLKGKLEGIGYFQQQILFRMVKSHPQDEFVFFFDRKYDTDFVFAKNVIPVVIPLPARHPLLWVLYFDYLLPLYIKKYKIDIFFSPENYIPGNCKIPTVCTIHDLNFYHNGKYIGDNWHQRYFMKYFPLNARKSDKIITVSNFSKDDISSSFGIDKSDIEVVYNASNPVYSPKPEAINISVKNRYTNGKDFFYFVGAIHRRKNLVNIFLSFDSFKRQTGSDAKLVIVGERKWWTDDMEYTYNNMNSKNDVVFTGRLEAESVSNIASASLALVFPSLFEGFGIPVIEAMASGTAVITSNTTSLPEVAGDAALLVNPYSVEEITAAMVKIYSSPALRQELAEKGLQRNKLFDWDNSSEKLWKILTDTKR